MLQGINSGLVDEDAIAREVRRERISTDFSRGRTVKGVIVYLYFETDREFVSRCVVFS